MPNKNERNGRKVSSERWGNLEVTVTALSRRSPGDRETVDLSRILFHIIIQMAKADSLSITSAYLFLISTVPGPLKWEQR